MTDCQCDKNSAPPRLPSTGATGRSTLRADQPSQIRGANPARRELVVVNETGGSIRVGYDETQVGETIGVLIVAGQSFTTSTTGAVWAYTTTAGPVSWAEEIDQ